MRRSDGLDDDRRNHVGRDVTRQDGSSPTASPADMHWRLGRNPLCPHRLRLSLRLMSSPVAEGACRSRRSSVKPKASSPGRDATNCRHQRPSTCCGEKGDGKIQDLELADAQKRENVSRRMCPSSLA